MPAISTGAYRFPLELAAEISLRAVAEFLAGQEVPEVVRFVLFKAPQLTAFKAALDRLETP